MILNLDKPSEKQVAEIYQELGTSSEALERDVKHIIEWINKQPHLPNINDENRIKHTLIFCKNSIEKAKYALDMYYYFKVTVPEFYGNRDPMSPELLLAMHVAMFVPLPRLTEDGYRVSIFKFFDVDSSKFNINDFIKVCFMSIDIRLQEDLCKGDILVYDFQGGNMAHMSAVLPVLKKIIYCGTTAMPMRQKTAHIINLPSYAESFVIMAKGFLKKKLVQRVYVHSNGYEELQKHIPKSVLPNDYGGFEVRTLSQMKDGWIEKLKLHRGWFLEENDVKSDESKRPAHRSTLEAEHVVGLGIEGSFRKINVD